MSSQTKLPYPLISLAIIVCMIAAGSLAGRELSSNCDLSGLVSYRGKAAVGTRIQAYAGSTLLADTSVQVAGYYAISIPPDDPATLSVDGWESGSEITIYVDGHPAQPTVTPTGGPLQQDISVPQISDVKKSTWGKIKALFR